MNAFKHADKHKHEIINEGRTELHDQLPHKTQTPSITEKKGTARTVKANKGVKPITKFQSFIRNKAK